MTILFYYDRPFLPNDGGIACITLSLVEVMEQNGHRILALAKRDPMKGHFLKEQYVLPCPYNIKDEDNYSYAKKLLRDKNVDIIINQQPIDDIVQTFWIEVRRMTGVKILSFFHNPITLSAKNYALTAQKRIEKKYGKIGYSIISNSLIKRFLYYAYIGKNRNRYRNIVENSDMVAVLCDGMKDELVDMIGYRPENIAVIPNFLSQIPSHIECSKKENLIVWCGQTNFSVKRLDVMLKLWKTLQTELPDWNLSVLGDGPDLDNAKKMAQTLHLNNIKFEGRVPPNSYYDRAKFVIVTSSYESFSLVTLEAMAHYALPLCFDTFPAARFLLQDLYKDLSAHAYDYSRMSKIILDYIQNEDKFFSFQQKVHDYALQFDSQYVYKLWIVVINKILQ